MDEASRTIRKNKLIADKFMQIETELPLFPKPADLFENLLIRLQEAFVIPFVWLSIVNRPDLSGLIQALSVSTILNDHLNIIDESSLLELVRNGAMPILANQDLQPFYRLFPANKKFFIKSIAIAPFMLDGRVIGCVNYGDADKMRYEPGLDTSLLQHLMDTVSVCLETLQKQNFR